MINQKKVLIITYHWPPSGGITVLRCLKFAKYLREHGWEPVIFTAENASYQFLDFTNEKDIPENLEVLKVPIYEPINAFKKLTGRKQNQPVQNITSNSNQKKSFIDNFAIWVRGNFFIPDARARWIKPSLKYLIPYLEKNPVDAILTDGPPHTNTMIGMRLAQKLNIPWLADFQDPWTQVDYYSQMRIGPKADRKHRALEQEVFRTADKITIASPSWKHDLERIGAKNVDVIYYGYDESDFTDMKKVVTDELVIFHGGLLGEDRNPEVLFAAIQKLVKSYPTLQSSLKLKFAGEVDYSVRESIKKYGLEDCTELMGMITRQEVIENYMASALLLLPINKAANAKGRIPGKLFEMLRSGKPILVLGPDDGDVKHIVESKELGQSFEYSDLDGIYTFLENGLIQQNFGNFNLESSVDEFSNRLITGKIAHYLDEIVTQKTDNV